MELKRKPFQGVYNIIRFNWHFYVLAFLVLLILILTKSLFPPSVQNLIIIGTTVAILTIVISLLVSLYIYDLSDLYQLKWIDNSDNGSIININAGFDETSEIIQKMYPNVELTICDFYNPVNHTEISIKRARQAYPQNPKIISVQTNHLPFANNTFDKSLLILSAHEIRDKTERALFFQEINRITKSSGQILVTEHLRDFNNFLAYTIGFFHFHSRKTWLQTFKKAGLTVTKEIKITPFITAFKLNKDGNTL